MILTTYQNIDFHGIIYFWKIEAKMGRFGVEIDQKWFWIVMSLHFAKILLKWAFFAKISIPILIPKLKMNSEINTDSDIEN